LRVRTAEALPVLALLAMCAALTVAAGPAMAYAHAAAHSLYNREEYIRAVLKAEVRPPPPVVGG
jgi:multicomponent K+:H+ antiporter subunit D